MLLSRSGAAAFILLSSTVTILDRSALAQTQKSDSSSPKAQKTSGLPDLFENDEIADAGLLDRLQFDKSSYVPKVLEIERKGKGTSAAIVGIERIAISADGRVSGAHGTGFLVSPCHAVTAAHVAMEHVPVGEKLRVGWGDVPKSMPAESKPLDRSFVHTTGASIMWTGPLPPVEPRGSEFNIDPAAPMYDVLENEEEGRFGRDYNDDWAILKLDKCVSSKVHYLQIPTKGGKSIDIQSRLSTIYVTALGYPNSKFDSVTATRCAYYRHNSDKYGIETVCKLLPGNSGGPLLRSTRDNVVRGIASFVSKRNPTTRFAPAAPVGFAMRMEPEPTPVGCVARLKTVFRPEFEKVARHFGEGSVLDDTLTKSFLYIYRAMASGLTKRTATGATFMPYAPDPFMCSTLAGYANYLREVFPSGVAAASLRKPSNNKRQEGDVEKVTSVGRLDDDIPLGSWRWRDFQFTVKKEKTGRTVDAIGEGFNNSKTYVTKMMYGRRIEISYIKLGNTESEYFTIDFREGHPPLMVSFKGLPVLEWMITVPTG